MGKKTRRNQEKRENAKAENKMKEIIDNVNKILRPAAERHRLKHKNESNFNKALEIPKELQKETIKRYCDELSVHQEEDDNYNKIERFDDYVIFADTSAWLPYLGIREKNENMTIKKLRASIIDNIISMNKKKNKKKILTTHKIYGEIKGKLENGFEYKSELEKAFKKYKNLVDGSPIHDIVEGGRYEKMVSNMYDKIWLNPKNAKKIDARAKIKTKKYYGNNMNSKEWTEKWKTLPEKYKKKGKPEGSDIIILGTICKYKILHMPTAVVFVTHDSDFTFFKNEIGDNLGIVLVDVYSLHRHLKNRSGYKYT